MSGTVAVDLGVPHGGDVYGGKRVIWAPQAGPQSLAITCPVTEILYGGSAGGGKSDWLLGDFATGIEVWGAAWRGILFRRSLPELEELIKRSMEIFGPVYGMECWREAKKTWFFPNGAQLKFRYLDKDSDVMQYQGHQFSWVGFDELTQWPNDFPYTYLFTRARSPHGAPVMFRAASNPGGPGHTWVKERWMMHENRKWAPGRIMRLTMENGSPHERVFIPAKLRDNQILLQNDPGYEGRMYQLSNPVLRKALIEGNWDIFAGQAFPEWAGGIHTIPNGKVPEGVEVWRSCDWGFMKPYCVLWFYSDYDGVITAFNELYGMGDGPNIGSQEPPSEVRDKIEAFESSWGLWVKKAYLDAQCWAKNDGEPSIAEKIGGARLGWQKWDKGPGSRVNQKNKVHEVLKVVNGRSRFRAMERCRNLIRTMPSLPVDPGNPEDVDTDSEDHAYDTLRGGLVQRVMTREEREHRRQMRARRKRKRADFGRYGGH